MSDWRHNSSGHWSNQGSGYQGQYPNSITEEELADDGEYYEGEETYTTAPQQEYQEGEWTAEPQNFQYNYAPYQTQSPTAFVADDQQEYQPEEYYPPPGDGQGGEGIRSPTTYTDASLDVNFR